MKPADFLAWVQKQKAQAREVVSYYEAGPTGFWLHRRLSALGVRNYVICPTRLDERHRGVANDRTDALELATCLDPLGRPRPHPETRRQTPRLELPRLLSVFARRVNPLLADLLAGMTDYLGHRPGRVLDRNTLSRRRHAGPPGSTMAGARHPRFSAEDVMTFPGRKLTGQFAGELRRVTNRRWPGARVQQRMKANWINSPRGRLSCGGKCTTSSAASCASKL